jgi:hypothetical protein
VDRAGAALRDAATKLGAGQTDRIAQRPEQRRIGLEIDLVLRSVDQKRDHRRTLALLDNGEF